MFEKRALQVRMIKNPQASDDYVEATRIDPEEINQIVLGQIEYATAAIVVVMVAHKFLNTISEIALITARAKIK